MSGVLRAPRTPCGRARPAPASVGFAALAWVDDGVVTLYDDSCFFRRRQQYLRSLFCPMRLRSLDSGRLFSANTAFRDEPFIHLYSGDFAEPFPPPLRASLRARRSSLRRAPQRAPRPLIPGRARPAPARRCRAYASRARLAAEKPASFSPDPGNNTLINYSIDY